MFVAAKYEEIMAASVGKFVYMTENSYSRKEILKREWILLQVSPHHIFTSLPVHADKCPVAVSLFSACTFK